MMSTDGVGTKLELARLASNWDGVGFDLVAMCVDDLAAVGARPIGFVDYLAVGVLDPGRDRAIVASVAAACARAGCALLGGETAEHPGVMPADAVDLAGAVMGVVEAGEELGPHRVEAGDLVVALASPNLRSNGFSLVRSALGETVSRHFDLLLQPSVIYSPAVSAATLTGAVHAAAHITGGGLPGNLARVLPDGLGIEIDTGTWRPPEVFDLIASAGVARDEMFSTFNMGVGFCLITPEARGDEVMAMLSEHEPWAAGRVVEGRGVGLT
jgi:phosphoribosylformylglycinamidine cyclo-ligase